MTDAQWEGLDHFGAHEFVEPSKMDYALLHRLDLARSEAGVAFTITSSFRAGDPRTHGRGWAVDISCIEARDRDKILRALLKHFTRVGVYNLHLHADVGDLHEPDIYPADVIWHGISKTRSIAA